MLESLVVDEVLSDQLLYWNSLAALTEIFV